jgi:hypothetical protein
VNVELLSQVAGRYAQATEFHKASAGAFHHLGLAGFREMHRYQFIFEGDTLLKIKYFISSTCGFFYFDSPSKETEINKTMQGLVDRKKIKSADRWKTVQAMYMAYERWEKETLELYEEIAKSLSEEGWMAEYAFAIELVKDVRDELARVCDEITYYSGMDWSIEQISAEQDAMAEKYIYRLRELYKNFPKYHHFNSM